MLDQLRQTLRLADLELAVESEAAFGLLGAAARAVMPHLERALTETTTVDLTSFTSNAHRRIADAITDFRRNDDGIKVDANISAIELSDIAFDSKTLRIIADAAGAITITVTKLPEL